VKARIGSTGFKINSEELRSLVWSAQDLLDSGDLIFNDIKSGEKDHVESIELWILAFLEPMIFTLNAVAIAIPGSIPDAAALRRKVTAIHSQCEICWPPFQESRPSVAVSQ
jgi:hypothetical protein